MGLHGSTWVYLGLLGSSWVYMGLLGSSWVYLDLLGCTWVYLGLLGSTWVYLGPLGSTWVYLVHLSLFQITIEWFRTLRAISGRGMDGWRLSPAASLLRAPYGANNSFKGTTLPSYCNISVSSNSNS